MSAVRGNGPEKREGGMAESHLGETGREGWLRPSPPSSKTSVSDLALSEKSGGKGNFGVRKPGHSFRFHRTPGDLGPV